MRQQHMLETWRPRHLPRQSRRRHRPLIPPLRGKQLLKHRRHRCHRLQVEQKTLWSKMLQPAPGRAKARGRPRGDSISISPLRRASYQWTLRSLTVRVLRAVMKRFASICRRCSLLVEQRLYQASRMHLRAGASAATVIYFGQSDL